MRSSPLAVLLKVCGRSAHPRALAARLAFERDERGSDAASDAPLPEFFVDGVPYRQVVVGRTAAGARIYESVRVEIPSTAPSLYYREGC